MKLHKRFDLVEKAEREFSTFILEWVKKHGLTYGEELGILADRIRSNAKYMIREERHPGQDKKGDEA